MAVNFTRQQIAELEEAMQRLAPPVPVARDLPQAKSVVSVATIGAPAGLLLNARMDDGSVTNLYINPVVALDLLTRIMGVARKGQWWDENVDLIPMPDTK